MNISLSCIVEKRDQCWLGCIFSKIAHLHYSLPIQDTRPSPERPGFEFRWAESIAWFVGCHLDKRRQRYTKNWTLWDLTPGPLKNAKKLAPAQEKLSAPSPAKTCSWGVCDSFTQWNCMQRFCLGNTLATHTALNIRGVEVYPFN